MQADSKWWHRGKILKIRNIKSSPLRYLVKFNFYQDDKNRWVDAHELLDDGICGDPISQTKGYGIILLDRRSYYPFGNMAPAQIKRLIIMRHCKDCQKFFRFIEVHEKEHGVGKCKKNLRVKFDEILKIQLIPKLDDGV